MNTKKEYFEVTELPAKFDVRPRTQQDYDKETSIEKGKRHNIIKKNFQYYQNNDNLYNNPYHTSKKLLSQYHQPKQDKEAILYSKLNQINNEDNQNANMLKRNFIFSGKKGDNDKIDRFRMNRLVLQGKSKQKVFQSNDTNLTSSKMDKLDQKKDNELTLMKSSCHNRIRTVNLWEDKEILNEKRLKADLTEKVLQGERNAIEMISKRFKDDNHAQDLQRQLTVDKANLARDTFQRQRTNNISKSLQVSYPENSVTNPINQSTNYNSQLRKFGNDNSNKNIAKNQEITQNKTSKSLNPNNLRTHQQNNRNSFNNTSKDNDIFEPKKEKMKDNISPLDFKTSKSAEKVTDNKRNLHKTSVDSDFFLRNKKVSLSTANLTGYRRTGGFTNKNTEEKSKDGSYNRILEPFVNDPNLEKPTPVAKRCMPFVINADQNGVLDDWKPRAVSDLKKYRDTYPNKDLTDQANHFMANSLRTNIQDYNSYDNTPKPYYVTKLNGKDSNEKHSCTMTTFFSKFDHEKPDEFASNLKFYDPEIHKSKKKQYSVQDKMSLSHSFNNLEKFKSETKKKTQMNGTAHPQKDMIDFNSTQKSLPIDFNSTQKSLKVDFNSTQKSFNTDFNLTQNTFKNVESRSLDKNPYKINQNFTSDIKINSNDDRISIINLCKKRVSTSNGSTSKFGQQTSDNRTMNFEANSRGNTGMKINKGFKLNSRGIDKKISSKTIVLKKYNDTPNDLLGNSDFNDMMTKSVNQLKLDKDNNYTIKIQRNFNATKETFDKNAELHDFVPMGYNGCMKKKHTNDILINQNGVTEEYTNAFIESKKLDFYCRPKIVESHMSKVNDYSTSLDEINNSKNTFSQINNFIDMKNEEIRYNANKYKQYPGIKFELYKQQMQHMFELEKTQKK